MPTTSSGTNQIKDPPTDDPVTRIEGHAKITIHLNEAGTVEEAIFHVTQLRGFEKFVEGRPFHEMPSLMARIFGICPVSHLMASAKACDMLMSVRIPPVAAKLRKILNLAQIAQSHALSFFYLSSPDLLLGMDAEPSHRNLVGVHRANPEVALRGVKLRQCGQKIIEMLGGKRIDPGWVVGGGVNAPLSPEHHQQILQMLPEAINMAEETLDWFAEKTQSFADEIEAFGAVQTLYMSLIGDEGELETCDGALRVVDDAGKILVDRLPSEKIKSIVDEVVTPNSYLKSPFYKPLGFPDGAYRVGPLARLKIATRCGTPKADRALITFKTLNLRSSFYYHWARLIEIIYAFEKIESLLNEPDILSEHVRAFASPNNFEGIGVAEAPRGTLMHHYKIDKHGLITYADLVIATGHNNIAMNKGITEVARRYLKEDNLNEGMLNRVEALIRTYDPCLSCSTHAFGQMPLHIQLIDSEGQVMSEVKR
jgi:NAD-reducing hydrogenase large subunit